MLGAAATAWSQDQPDDGSDPPSPPPQSHPELDVGVLRVQVRPQFEFLLPLGVLSQSFTAPVGQAELRSNVRFDVPGAVVAATLSLRRRIGSWEPEIRGSQTLNAGAIVDPGWAAGEVRVTDPSQTIDRVRSYGTALRWIRSDARSYVAEIDQRNTLFIPVDGTEPVSTLDEILPTLAVEFNNLRRLFPKRSTDATGAFLRVSINQRFIDDFSDPISASLGLNGLWYTELGTKTRLEQRLAAVTPVVVWDEQRVSQLEIGGYESLRGYPDNAVEAWRTIIVGNTVAWLFAEDADLPLPGRRRLARIHSPRALIAADLAISQAQTDPYSSPRFDLGAGPGLSFTVSVGHVHVEMSSYIAWAIGRESIPVFIFRGALL